MSRTICSRPMPSSVLRCCRDSYPPLANLAACTMVLLSWLPAAQASSFCQQPNQDLNGASGDTLWRTSDSWIGSGAVPAENVSVATEVSVIRVRWWGTYYYGVTISGCPGPASDDFEIHLYEDDGSGLPGELIHTSVLGDVTRQETALTLIAELGMTFVEYRYEAELDGPVALTPDTVYWLSIRATHTLPPDDTCVWAWETAPAENHSARWWPGSGVWEADDVDLAYCLFDGDAVPALSTWGVLAMTLLVLTAGTLVYARRRPIHV